MKYKVYKFEAFSPGELEAWLNQVWLDEDLELVGVDNGYYIFHAAQPISRTVTYSAGGGRPPTEGE